MYCVKCGVKLESGVARCPLCATPVWNPGGEASEGHYNAGLYPEKNRAARYFGLALATALMAAAALACLIICLNLYDRVYWSGLAMLGTALLYIVAVLPFWFPKYCLWVFVPLDFAAIEGFLVYVNAYVHGRWFLSFAFPVTGLVFLLTLGGIGLVLYHGKGRLRMIGIYLMVFGGFTMLIEMFEHITFGTPMFLWSLYTAGVYGLLGLFLFVASFIPSVHNDLRRRFVH